LVASHWGLEPQTVDRTMLYPVTVLRLDDETRSVTDVLTSYLPGSRSSRPTIRRVIRG
jgi:hypothetical protein